MTVEERIKLLVDELCGGKLGAFAERTNISLAVISKMISGKAWEEGITFSEKYIRRICDAYPQINPDWLRTGEGHAGEISPYYIKKQCETLLNEKDKEIEFLKGQLVLLQKMLNKLLS